MHGSEFDTRRVCARATHEFTHAKWCPPGSYMCIFTYVSFVVSQLFELFDAYLPLELHQKQIPCLPATNREAFHR